MRFVIQMVLWFVWEKLVLLIKFVLDILPRIKPWDFLLQFFVSRKEGLELVARQMREEGYPLSEIAKLTKLEPKEISLL